MPYKVVNRIQLYINKDSWPYIRVVQLDSEYCIVRARGSILDSIFDGAFEPAYPPSVGTKSFTVVVEVADEKDALDNPIWRRLDLTK